MKHLLQSTILLLALLMPAVACAYDIKVDGIYYDIINNEAVVTYEHYSSYTYYYSDYSGDVTIPATVSWGNKTYPVTAIGEHAFYECTDLRSVVIPNSVTSIGSAAFSGCSGLTSVNIPNSVLSINGFAFEGCSALTSIFIPESVTYIETWTAFNGCSGLTSIVVASGNSVYDSRNNCNAIIDTQSNALCVGCQNTVIPSTVVSIAGYAFHGRTGLTSIVIPNSVTEISNNAFYGCSGLTWIKFPNSVTSISYYAFYGCSALTSIIIPESVTWIATGAFAGCSSLSSIAVENNNPVYDSRNNCNAIILTENNSLLTGCQNTVIPASVMTIEESAFEGCSKLKSITIPSSVTKINNRAFSGCTGLKHIYSKVSDFSNFKYQSEIFGDVPTATCVLHVPYGTARVYSSMRQWCEFKNIEEMGNPYDANGDQEVNIADINSLVDLILSGAYAPNADANGDGELTIADVNALVSRILDGEEDYISEGGLYLLDDIYRFMHMSGWSTTSNTHQCFGISAYNLMAEVMGDDMIMGAQGNGWFWYDAAYDVKFRYTSSSWRSYDLWTAYYTWIAKANQILELMEGTHTPQSDYVRGQAYAIRAYSYFMLAQSFARTYAGHQSDPCVPLFAGTSFAGTGQPRATVAEVYAQIDGDISKAIQLLDGTRQLKPSHMGLAVALGLQARIALVKEDWSTALTAARAAITASGREIQDVPSFIGLNDAQAGNVMWGVEIPMDEVGMYASLFSHMSNNGVVYGQRAPKKISSWLYNKMGATDTRREWWYGSDGGYSETKGYIEYHEGFVQKKFEFSNPSTWEGDYIWMRVEEMYLTAAEAACRLGNETEAKSHLMQLMSKRDPNYACNKTGTGLGSLTTSETGSLLEEILLQRRLELWGEDGRIYTIRRLKQGFERLSDYGWPDGLLVPTHAEALKDRSSYAWVMTIPQVEFDGNVNMSPDPIPNGDQNPIGDYPE